jgi:hypothetical protein
MSISLEEHISGSVGYTLLERDNMIVLLFADIHDGIEYCDQSKYNKFIADWLNEKSDKYEILLEEIIREDLKLTELWPNAKHTQELKHLNKNNSKIIPIDIRPMLVPFSWELVKSVESVESIGSTNRESVKSVKSDNSTTSQLGYNTLQFYINNLEKLFNQESYFFKKYFEEKIDTMKKNQSSVSGSKLSPLVHYNELHKLFNEFKDQYKEMMGKNIFYIIKNRKEILYRINNIISMIMEWYSVLLIYNNSKYKIIHIGLAHSNRLYDILTQVYRFNCKYKVGINKMIEIPNNIPSACVMLSPDVTNMFNRKYGFIN